MHILAGKYKGRRIITPADLSCRPTQTRIRKSLFDILGDISEKIILDLYAGSGILGFEAASRGAAEITFVEKSQQMVRLLRKNCYVFTKNIFCVRNVSVETFLRTNKIFDIIIADPPYELLMSKQDYFRESIIDLCINRLKLQGTFVLEMSSRSDIVGDKEKYYGDTKLVFWNKK